MKGEIRLKTPELPSYERVKSYVLHLGKHDSAISVMAIRQHFKISTPDAARFVIQLENNGVISRLVGGEGRKLLIKEDQGDCNQNDARTILTREDEPHGKSHYELVP